MNKFLIFVTVFSLGYITNDVMREYNLDPIGKVYAEVAGMNYYDLRSDYDFKRAVRKVVENYCESESDGDISC